MSGPLAKSLVLLGLIPLLVMTPASAKSLKQPPPPPEPVVEPAPVVPAGPDRGQPPAVQPATPLSLPAPVAHTLWEGLTVQHVQVPGLRKTQIAVILHRGSVGLCGQPAPGCDALGQLLGVATENTGASAMEEALVLLDGSLDGWMGSRDTALTLSVPPDQLDAGLSLLREALLTPAFPKDELKLLARDTLLNYESSWPVDLGTVASMTRTYGWFPADTPFGARPDLDGWRKLKAKSLKQLHTKLLAEAPATVLVVGSTPWETLEPGLREALEGVGKPGQRTPDTTFAAPSATRVLAVDMPGQPQAAIRLRVAAPAGAAPERSAFQVAHFALGGSFMSRLNRVLREEKGWTYGAYGRYSPNSSYGMWDFGVDVAVENVQEAVQEIELGLGRMSAEGPTEDELAAARVDQLQTWNQRLATSDSAESWYFQMLILDDSVQASRARLDAIGAVSVAEAQKTAGAVVGEAAPRLWVVVGDRAALEPELAALGWQPTWLDPRQAVLGKLP